MLYAHQRVRNDGRLMIIFFNTLHIYIYALNVSVRASLDRYHYKQLYIHHYHQCENFHRKTHVKNIKCFNYNIKVALCKWKQQKTESKTNKKEISKKLFKGISCVEAEKKKNSVWPNGEISRSRSLKYIFQNKKKVTNNEFSCHLQKSIFLFCFWKCNWKVKTNLLLKLKWNQCWKKISLTDHIPWVLMSRENLLQMDLSRFLTLWLIDFDTLLRL